MSDRIRRYCRCAVPSLLVLAFAGQAGAADTEVTIGSERGSTTYEVALDELQVQCIAPAALPEQVRSMTPDGKTRLSGITSLPQLETVASTLARGAAGRTTLAAVLYPAGGNRDPANRSILSRQLSLHVKAGNDPATVAGRHRCRVIETLGSDAALVEPLEPGLLAGSRAASDLAGDPAVRAAQVQVHRLVATRYTPIDPEYHPQTGANPWVMIYVLGGIEYQLPERKQWHLHRAPRGMMLEPVWGSARDVKGDIALGVSSAATLANNAALALTGSGIRIATVDTGLDTAHPDLGVYPDGNLQTDLAYNFAGGLTDDVRPQSIVENHGTAIAGLIAEREGLTGREGTPPRRQIAVGGVGVAFDATVVPLRFITSRDMGKEDDPLLDNGGPADPNQVDPWPGKSEWDFKRTVQYQLNPQSSGKQIHVSCNSWGNTGVTSFSPLGIDAISGFESGVSTGRYQRGLIFVWAAGNDHGQDIPYHPDGRGTDLLPTDNASYDAWLNRFTLPIGSLNRIGRRSSFSEIGPSLLVCAPGGEYNFSPYEDPTVGADATVRLTPGSYTPSGFLGHGLTTTDRSRQVLSNGIFDTDPGYNPGEQANNGDPERTGDPDLPPTAYEDLWQWYFGIRIHGDGNPDFYDEEDLGFDLDGDGYMDTGEDLDHDGRLDNKFYFDIDGDLLLHPIKPAHDLGTPHWDLGEDVNNNGILDDGEDLNGDGILQFNEDLNGDGLFWPGEDLNHDYILDPGEDVNGNGILDLNEDIDNDGHFDGPGYVQYTPIVGPPINTFFTSEGLWANGAGEPDFNRNGIQDGALVVDIYMSDGSGGYTSRLGIVIDEDLNDDGDPTLDPPPIIPGFVAEGQDFYFDRFEDFNHNNALERTSDLNADGVIIGFEDYNNDAKWTSGDYTQWSNAGYTHPNGPGFDVAGTSYAAANASGLIALMLQARPELTWRDVQLILAHRARLPGRDPAEGLGSPAGVNRGLQPIAPAFFTFSDYDHLRGLRYDVWTPSAIQPNAGFFYNHWYGFGAINAVKAIYGSDTTLETLGAVPATLAHTGMVYPGWPVPLADQVANPGALRWPLLPAEELPITASAIKTGGTTGIGTVDLPSTGITIPFADGFDGQPRLNLDLLMEVPGGVTNWHIETVELHVDITISNRSRLTLGLVSPSGTVAMIPQRVDKNGGMIDRNGPTGTQNLNYTFTLRNFLGEHPQGNWRIIVLDTVGTGGLGIFNSGSITVHGHRTYPVPTASSTTPTTGIPAAVGTTFQINGSGFRRNASDEVTMTKVLWIDHSSDSSVESADVADDDAVLLGSEDLDGDGILDVLEDLDADGVLDAGEDIDGDGKLDLAEDTNGNGILDLNTSIPAGSTIADLEVAYQNNGVISVKVPSNLTAISPGDATIIIGNPALPIGQSIPSATWQIHTPPRGLFPSDPEAEDIYVLDHWENSTTSIIASDSFLKGTHQTYPAGVDPITGVAFPAGYDCRIRSTGINGAVHLSYSRAPTITTIPDQLMPAGTSTPAVIFTFTVDDPDINPATVNAGRTGLEENLTVSYQVFNQSVVRQSDMPATAVVPRAVLQTITAPIIGSSGLSIVTVSVTDGVTTTTTSFRVGILTDETASGCGGGMGLALLGGPLAIWLFRRRRRA